jgi:hypothetical protein
MMNSGYSFAGINVGIVLGGGYHNKKKRQKHKTGITLDDDARFV